MQKSCKYLQKSSRPFYDQFVACVDNLDISDVQKFSYLLLCFSGKARSAVMGISCTAANYRPTMGSLRERFGDPSLLIGLYADKLVHVEGAKDNDVASFRRLWIRSSPVFARFGSSSKKCPQGVFQVRRLPLLFLCIICFWLLFS